MIKCKVCLSEVKNNKALFLHLKKLHKDISAKTYYLTYIDSSVMDKCPSCGKALKFISITRGFRKTCGEYSCTVLTRKKNIKKAVKEKYGVDNISQLDSTKIKVKSTCIKRYKVSNVYQKPNNRQKSKETCQRKYKADSALQCKEVRELGKDGYSFLTLQSW
jgi:hypothetical protein